MNASTAPGGIANAAIDLERDVFLRSLLRELAGVLQEIVGVEEAEGFISVVGQRIGDQLNETYRTALNVKRLTREQIKSVLVDLKRRIEGDFYVIEDTPERIVLGNRACPFGEMVQGRPALCMMTSNVFGVIASSNLGFAKVDLEQTIAKHHEGCRIVIYTQPTPEAEAAYGREYFEA